MSKNIVRAVYADNNEQAIQLYKEAKDRLLHVNNWEHISKGISASFRLTDDKGNPVERMVKVNDYFRINLPAPKNESGKGDDWVKVEAMEECGSPEQDEQAIAVRARPYQAPVTDQDTIAHFLDESATSTFLVQRKGTVVMAAVYGRNERPNTEGDSIANKVRNTLVAIGAIAGIADLQWDALAKGILQVDSQSLT